MELRHAPSEAKKRIRAALRKLILDPLGRDPHLDVVHMRSDFPDPGWFRVRVGDWRVFYTFDAETLYVLRVIHRGEEYDWMDRLDEAKWPFGPP